MNGSERRQTAIILALFAGVFVFLTVSSYRQNSATADEPITLTAGYTILKLGDYRIHPDNVPLLRVWSALPLLATGVTLDTNTQSWTESKRLAFTHEFLYRQNDADRLLNRARFMTVLLGLGLGVLLFFWAREMVRCRHGDHRARLVHA